MIKKIFTMKIFLVVTIIIITFINFNIKNAYANENNINKSNEITQEESIIENQEVNNKLNSLYNYINNVKSDVEIMNDLDPVEYIK